MDPRDTRVIYAAGFKASAWRSADRGLTWRRIPGFDFKWAHRVIVDPRDPARIFITTFGGSVWYGDAEQRTQGQAPSQTIEQLCSS